uniref:Uncharacterized protein n=1 Tax=Geospiza parvula TaxID=87175 RepID=A0A8U8BY26_GEOPR
MLPCSLWPLLALALGGSPHAPHPHFGAPHGHEDPQGLFYDHAALWGAQEAREQRELPPEESRRRLGLLVGLMDADASGLLSRAELRAWILRRHRGSRQAALRSESARLDRDSDGVVTWHEFSAQSFGDTQDFGGSPDPEAHRKLLERSRRRFRAADEDGDGRLEAAGSTPSCTPRTSPGSRTSWCRRRSRTWIGTGTDSSRWTSTSLIYSRAPPAPRSPPRSSGNGSNSCAFGTRTGTGAWDPPRSNCGSAPPAPTGPGGGVPESNLRSKNPNGSKWQNRPERAKRGFLGVLGGFWGVFFQVRIPKKSQHSQKTPTFPKNPKIPQKIGVKMAKTALKTEKKWDF